MWPRNECFPCGRITNNFGDTQNHDGESEGLSHCIISIHVETIKSDWIDKRCKGMKDLGPCSAVRRTLLCLNINVGS